MMWVHPACQIGEYPHDRHYLGRNPLGIPERCEGFDYDYIPNETGWTGL